MILTVIQRGISVDPASSTIGWFPRVRRPIWRIEHNKREKSLHIRASIVIFRRGKRHMPWIDYARNVIGVESS
jgi:hypothetical protein